jgi:dTDP-4-amino-4,6-dideoxygalactose transaminase
MREDLDRALESVLASQHFILGPAVESFECASAEYLGAKYAIAVSSGSDALVCALLALGIGPGDEVITTPFSFFASVESILRIGAKPRFVDILPNDFGIDPSAVEAALSPKTRAILAVHLYGSPANVDRLEQIAAAAKVPLIEDAAQAFGARFRGRAAGTFGALGCFSFHPSKPLGAWGDAGLVVTNDASLAERCRLLRSHGAVAKHRHELVGGNYRMDTLHAAVLERKLGRLERWLGARRELAKRYDAAIREISGISQPRVPPHVSSSFALYTVRIPDERRDALQSCLADQEIQTAVHYPLPIHLQPALRSRGLGLNPGSLPTAECAAREVLSLPLYPELSTEQFEYVVNAIRSFFEG